MPDVTVVMYAGEKRPIYATLSSTTANLTIISCTFQLKSKTTQAVITSPVDFTTPLPATPIIAGPAETIEYQWELDTTSLTEPEYLGYFQFTDGVNVRDVVIDIIINAF